MSFGNRLRELRQEKGITNKELSLKIGYSMGIISEWENDKRQPTLKALIALATFFEVTLDSLAGLEN